MIIDQMGEDATCAGDQEGKKFSISHHSLDISQSAQRNDSRPRPPAVLPKVSAGHGVQFLSIMCGPTGLASY